MGVGEVSSPSVSETLVPCAGFLKRSAEEPCEQLPSFWSCGLHDRHASGPRPAGRDSTKLLL